MGHGGVRPNSGRPKKDTVALQVRIPAEQADKVRAIAKEKGITLAEAISEVIRPSE